MDKKFLVQLKRCIRLLINYVIPLIFQMLKLYDIAKHLWM
ncbi:hypothetical protein SAMN05880556_10757 [Azospirillum sp. RU38E]|nr:hypothetical protein SAMN05880556_10757 [Azospirillum sp. RU38E]SNS75243.1 hypothetical protein SAMN05880591_10757 [Azospirillum sp. RU37A]